ncbi:uncharacterized protein LOC129304066 [Prosopis cineraria]|uniref:uncharacterized protein LOC129304066 n=1 Tax=Prosopis cineraria TaxID=364024 RepID=UPI00240EB985|nr:uncharacterized protein LOC129304066 [Prosopis cineraria]
MKKQACTVNTQNQSHRGREETTKPEAGELSAHTQKMQWKRRKNQEAEQENLKVWFPLSAMLEHNVLIMPDYPYPPLNSFSRFSSKFWWQLLFLHFLPRRLKPSLARCPHSIF